MKCELEVDINHTKRFHCKSYARVWMRRNGMVGYGEHDYNVQEAMRYAYDDLTAKILATLTD